MEITSVPFNSYGFTLRKTKLENVTETTYRNHLSRLPCSVNGIVFEQESGLHCHGVMLVPKIINIHTSVLFRFRGWHLHLVDLYDPLQWDLYLNKHQPSPTIDMVDTPEEEVFNPPKKSLFR